jgi:magnesium transporter
MQKHGGNFEIESGTCALIHKKVYHKLPKKTTMGQTKTEFIHFDWVDLENPNMTELSELVQPFGVSLNLLEDALQIGHLPKIEKVGEFNFLILRAYSASKQENLSEIAALTNKIGFFFNDQLVLTIHQKHFPFLTSLKSDYPTPESLILKITEKMLETYRDPADWLAEEMDKFEQGVFLNKSKKFSVERLYYDKAKARACKKLMLLTQLVLNQIIFLF